MVSRRLAPFGSTIFSQITARAQATGAVDLGQGYPSWEGPSFVKQAAIEAILHSSNQRANLGRSYINAYNDFFHDSFTDSSCNTVRSGRSR